MKKHIFLCIVLCMAAIGMSQAQETQLFRFVGKRTNSEGQKLVLHHNLDDNKANAVAISNEDFNAKDGYLQAFILKRVSPGKVLIASAKKSTHFLKRSETIQNGSTNEITFSPITDTDNLDAYTWEIEFAGNNSDEIIIQASGLHQHGVGVFPEGTAKTVRISNTSGQPLSNGGTVGDTYRFTMQRITNVF